MSSQNRRRITARYAGTCRGCGVRFDAGTEVWWASGAGSVCGACEANAGNPAGLEALINEARADEDDEYRREKARINEISRRYGPAGKFNRAEDALRARRLAASKTAHAQNVPDLATLRRYRDEVKAAMERTFDSHVLAVRLEQIEVQIAKLEDGMDDYCGEDDLTEAAIEARNDEWASMQTEIDARHGM
jgi:hypothetical protein